MSPRASHPSPELRALQHQLGLQLEALGSVREYLVLDLDDSRKTWEAIAELRDELHALANRVENLTRRLADDGREHSRRVVRAALAEPLVVVNLESEPPAIIGNYLGTREDTVDYVDPERGISHAPADCVAIYTPARAQEFVEGWRRV